jgi:hypothetical protein
MSSPWTCASWMVSPLMTRPLSPNTAIFSSCDYSFVMASNL